MNHPLSEDHNQSQPYPGLGMLRRTLSACSEVKTRADLLLVRPQLECSGEAWNPYTQNDIKHLEQVQHQAAHFVHSDYSKTTHVTPLVQGLDWDTLHTRRQLNQAAMFYKIQFNFVYIQLPPYFLLSTSILLKIIQLQVLTALFKR